MGAFSLEDEHDSPASEQMLPLLTEEVNARSLAEAAARLRSTDLEATSRHPPPPRFIQNEDEDDRESGREGHHASDDVQNEEQNEYHTIRKVDKTKIHTIRGVAGEDINSLVDAGHIAVVAHRRQQEFRAKVVTLTRNNGTYTAGALGFVEEPREEIVVEDDFGFV
jgi:hypothetical protein